MKNYGLEKSGLSNRDIGIIFIPPARQNAGGEELLQLREGFRTRNNSARRTGKT